MRISITHKHLKNKIKCKFKLNINQLLKFQSSLNYSPIFWMKIAWKCTKNSIYNSIFVTQIRPTKINWQSLFIEFFPCILKAKKWKLRTKNGKNIYYIFIFSSSPPPSSLQTFFPNISIKKVILNYRETENANWICFTSFLVTVEYRIC